MQNGQTGITTQLLKDRRSDLDNNWFGVVISNVEQIVSPRPIAEVTNDSAYAKGIINLRGSGILLMGLGSARGQKLCMTTITA